MSDPVTLFLPVTLSLNEFRALLRKAFEGLYAHDQDWNALADLVLWLEFHGLSGLDVFLGSASSLPGPAPISYRDDEQILVNGNGASLLTFNNRACDLLLADANMMGQSQLRVINVKHQDIIAASVARCAEEGFASVAWWIDEGGTARVVFQQALDQAPKLYKIQNGVKHVHNNEITIMASKHIADIESSSPDWVDLNEDNVLQNQISNRYDEFLDHGFSLSGADYGQLCQLANKVLVEATEKSRQGAGE